MSATSPQLRLLPLLLPLCLACGVQAGPEKPSAAAGFAAADRAYAAHVRNAPEHRPVAAPRTDRWDTWLYMPWRYRWTIGTEEEGGRFCRDYAINGAMTDHGKGPLEWLERWGLRFYNDHTAGKGALFLLPSPGREEALKDPRAVRPRPLDDALKRELQATISRNVRAIRGSPLRVAYALDDEISWGVLARPAVWRINDDDGAYQRWLDAIYGGQAPEARWVTPDPAFAQLDRPLGEIDLSPLLDRLTYNDSVFANFVGGLVEHCQGEDPDTPCGFVGGQGPGAWGGYDWAKLARKVRFVEAYDLGSAQEILRSLAPDVPRVTTHFHHDDPGGHGPANDSWLAWHYFAHGNRGMIGWVDDTWFEGTQPRAWLGRFRDTLRELGGVQGPKMKGARWLHDGIAIYYSHPSVQVSWFLDAAAHGKTWPNRNADHRLGTSHNVRKAWELLLNDAGLQYDFLAYDRVIASGVPPEYRVLILPACYALSQAEADRIAAFAEAGGTVIADFACGLFDPHGRGRSRGVLDGLFGVEHDGRETRRDFFGADGELWVETDQDAGYSFTRYRELFATVQPRVERGYAVAERRLSPGGTSRQVGRGRAVYLNLSPQRYLQDREEGTATEERRRPFLDPVRAAGVAPWIEVVDPGTGRPVPGLEVTAWSQGGSEGERTLVFVLQNVPIASSPTGGGGAVGLKTGPLPLEVRLAAPVRNAADERTGKRLGDGKRFHFVFDQAEAVSFSFAGKPPKSAQASTVP